MRQEEQQQRITIKNQMFLLKLQLFMKPSFLVKILLVISLLTKLTNVASGKEIGLDKFVSANEEIGVSMIDDDVQLKGQDVVTTMMSEVVKNNDDDHMTEQPEPSKLMEVTESGPTSTVRTRRTRTTNKPRKEYTKVPKDRQRQRPTRFRTPFLTGPYSLYQRTSSISPVIYPTKPSSDPAEPVAEPHPLNINLSVYVYPQKEETDDDDDEEESDQSDDTEKRKIKDNKKGNKPVLVTKEKYPVLPAGFEPIDIDLDKIVVGKELESSGK